MSEEREKKKVLVTGASGYLGVHLCRSLLREHFIVRAFVRPTSDVGFLRSATSSSLLQIAYGDVTDLRSLVDACSGCDVVFHAAALVEPWLPDPSRFSKINVEGLKNVLQACKENETIQKIIYTSSFFALGCTDGYVADENQVHDEKFFCTEYERSKAIADKIARESASDGLPLVLVYPGVIYGQGKITAGNLVARLGSTRHGPRSRGNALSTSPVSSRVFSTGPESPLRKQDEMRSPSHPLPLPPSSPTSPASRSLQSKWKKGKLIGRGTFGHVYAGFNRESGQMCAIKEVEVISDDSNSKESLKQLAQEINLLSQLSQTNIVQYYGSELVDFTLSVYLEYVSGGSIHKLLQDYGPFGEPVIRSYAGQILSGLAYLHGRNTIHRDIKGANILVDPYGEIKLADFGMAKHISSYTSIRSFKGSPYWMAPEVIMNTSGYNLSVDIWSLGCTIIEMATAKPPWSQYTGVQAIFKIGNSKDIPEIPNHLSDEGKNFLMLCLQRDPSLRPSAVQLMDHPFVRDQAKIKISNGNIVRDAYPSNPSSSDGCCSTMTTNDFSYNRHPTNAYNRSTSPIQNREYLRKETAVGFFPVSRTPSDLSGLRSNMSLPVSPCSSPLRQFRSSNWSCLPSPPHPMGTSNYGLRNNLSYPLVNSNRYTHNLPEASVPNGHAIYGSPRR